MRVTLSSLLQKIGKPTVSAQSSSVCSHRTRCADFNCYFLGIVNNFFAIRKQQKKLILEQDWKMFSSHLAIGTGLFSKTF